MGTTLISMFIRIKKRKNAKYAYLVRNRRYKTKPRHRQKVVRYLGRVLTPEKQPGIKVDITNLTFKESVINLLKTELINHDFKEKNNEFIQDNIKVSIEDKTVTKNNKIVSIELNEGFLNNYTLKELLNFEFNIKQPPLIQGHNLANLLISSGIKLSPSKFLKLFKKIHNP